MADRRFKLMNTTNYTIGFTRPSGAEESIRAGRIAYVTQDEIENEAACMEKWLRSGELVCEDQAVYDLFNIDRTAAIVAYTDDELLEKLKMPMKQFTAWLDELEGEAVLRRVFTVACKADTLPIRKIEMIEKKTGLSVQDVRRRKDDE